MQSYKFIIYAIVEPHTSEVRYIGKSVNGLSRPKAHFRATEYNKGVRPIQKWMKQRTESGVIPEIKILEISDRAEDLSALEIKHIAEHRATKSRLLNCTAGGDGSLGRPVPNSIREFLSKKFKGRKISDELKRKISDGVRGKEVTSYTRNLIRKNNPRSQPVLHVATGIIYDSLRAAGKLHGISHRSIERWIAKGRTDWRYV